MNMDKIRGLFQKRYAVVVAVTIVAFSGGIGVNALMSTKQDNHVAVTEDSPEENKESNRRRTISPPPELIGPGDEETETNTSVDYDYDYEDNTPSQSTSNQQTSSRLEPEVPVCLDEVKDSYVSLYNSRVSNEETKHDNAVSQEEFSHEQNKRDINNDWNRRGMSFGGGREAEINEEIERHERAMRTLKSNHENTLVALKAEHRIDLASIDCP